MSEYEAQHPLIPCNHGSIGEITITGKSVIFFNSDDHHDPDQVRAAQEEGYIYWGTCDTWRRKSEGGYTMHFMCRDESDVKSLGVNLMVYEVDYAIENFMTV